jgi:hypothetical protein
MWKGAFRVQIQVFFGYLQLYMHIQEITLWALFQLPIFNPCNLCFFHLTVKSKIPFFIMFLAVCQR